VKAKRQVGRELLLETVILVGLVASIVALWPDNGLLWCLVLGESVSALLLWHRREDVAIYAASGLVAALAEVVFVHSGVWHYANPVWLGVPIWFTPAFATAALCGLRLARTTIELCMNRQSEVMG